MTSPDWTSAQVEHLRAAARAAETADGPGIVALGVSYTQSQADLARMSGITPNTLTTIKRGKRPTAAHRAAILWAIARALGIA